MIELMGKELKASLDDLQVAAVTEADLAELLVLQRCCFAAEALALNTLDIPALRENLCELKASVGSGTNLVARRQGRLVASVRAQQDEGYWDIRRLMVAPDQTGQGLGSRMMAEIEQRAPRQVGSFRLYAAEQNQINVSFFANLGYRVTTTLEPPRATAARMVIMEKPRRG